MDFDIADVSIVPSVATTAAIWLLSIGAVFVKLGPTTSKYGGFSASVLILAGFVGTAGIGSGFTSARSAYVDTEALLVEATVAISRCAGECNVCTDIQTAEGELENAQNDLFGDSTLVDDATQAANVWPHVFVALLLALWAMYGGLRWYTNRRFAWVGCALALLCSLCAGGLVYAHMAGAEVCASLHRRVLDSSEIQPLVSKDGGTNYLTDALATVAEACPGASKAVTKLIFPGFVEPIYDSLDSALCTDVVDNVLVLAVVLFVASVATPAVDAALHFWPGRVESPGATNVPLLTF